MTATEDRMRASIMAAYAEDKSIVQAVAAVADAMVAEAVGDRDVLILTLTGERDMLRERVAKLQGEMV